MFGTSGELLTLKEAAALESLRWEGKKVQESCILNWTTVGVVTADGARIHLKCIKAAGATYVTISWLHEFLKRTK